MSTDILPIQPSPLRTQIAYLPVGDSIVTAIARAWGPGDSRRCRLCPECGADHRLGMCLVMIGEPVPRDSAPLFDLRGGPIISGTEVFPDGTRRLIGRSALV